MAVVPLLAGAVLLAGWAAVRRAPDPRVGRSTATRYAAAATVGVATAMVAERLAPGRADAGVALFAPGAGRWMPFVTCLAGVAATALAPVTPAPTAGPAGPAGPAGSVPGLAPVTSTPMAADPRGTFARILLVLACGTAATSFGGPGAALASWALAAFVVWRELLDQADRSLARVFGRHHLLGVGACALGLLLPGGAGVTAGLLVALGVGVRQCLLPLHLWHEPLARGAPPGILVAFAAGPAGLLLLPEMTRTLPGRGWENLLVAAAAATAMLGAGLGLVARDVRTALARVGLALSGIVSCGLLAGSALAAAGAVLAWQVGAVATAGMTMIAAATEARRGRMELAGQGGCFARTPRLAVAFLLFGLTAVGYPATVGFVWEDLLLDGVGSWFLPLGGALALAVAGSGATVVKWYFAGYTGRRDHVGEHDLTTREFRAATGLLAALVLAQFHPAFLLARP